MASNVCGFSLQAPTIREPKMHARAKGFSRSSLVTCHSSLPFRDFPHRKSPARPQWLDAAYVVGQQAYMRVGG